jgi:hypothetical protein
MPPPNPRTCSNPTTYVVWLVSKTVKYYIFDAPVACGWTCYSGTEDGVWLCEKCLLERGYVW